jgi:hypothetical protein
MEFNEDALQAFTTGMLLPIPFFIVRWMMRCMRSPSKGLDRSVPPPIEYAKLCEHLSTRDIQLLELQKENEELKEQRARAAYRALDRGQNIDYWTERGGAGLPEDWGCYSPEDPGGDWCRAVSKWDDIRLRYPDETFENWWDLAEYQYNNLIVQKNSVNFRNGEVKWYEEKLREYKETIENVTSLCEKIESVSQEPGQKCPEAVKLAQKAIHSIEEAFEDSF